MRRRRIQGPFRSLDVDVPVAISEQLHALAKRREITLNDLASEALNFYLLSRGTAVLDAFDLVVQLVRNTDVPPLANETPLEAVVLYRQRLLHVLTQVGAIQRMPDRTVKPEPMEDT